MTRDEVAELLVGKGLQRCRVEGLAVEREGALHGVLGHDRLAGPRGRSHQHGLPGGQRPDRLLLEAVEGEGIAS